MLLRASDPEKHREAERIYRTTDSFRASCREYRIKNRERVNENSRRYYSGKKLTHAQRVKNWKINNKKKHSMYCLSYQASRRSKCRKLANSPAVLTIYRRASELREWFNVVVDHIIPLSKGGAHKASNLQIIYASENTMKRDKVYYSPKVVFS